MDNNNTNKEVLLSVVCHVDGPCHNQELFDAALQIDNAAERDVINFFHDSFSFLYVDEMCLTNC